MVIGVCRSLWEMSAADLLAVCLWLGALCPLHAARARLHWDYYICACSLRAQACSRAHAIARFAAGNNLRYRCTRAAHKTCKLCSCAPVRNVMYMESTSTASVCIVCTLHTLCILMIQRRAVERLMCQRRDAPGCPLGAC